MDYTKYIIKQVTDIVGEVYLVGGSVRDLLLKRTPHDFDFATPILPDEVEARIQAAGRHAYTIGKKFGTLGFKIKDENGVYQYVEVTTFRSEQYHPGNRKPDVQFVSELDSDLARRDFTMNAIALSEDYHDPFGGQIDILEEKIKAVGKSSDRFKEDPLRMLRAPRFAAQLGFEVDPNMIGFIRKMAPTIVTISRERWVQEMDKLLLSPYPIIGLGIMYQTGLLKYMLPEVHRIYGVPFCVTRLGDALTNAEDDADIRWALLFIDIGKAVIATEDIMSEWYTRFPHEELIGLELARGIGTRLKFSNKRIAVIEDMFKNKQGWEKKYVPEEKVQRPE